MDRTFALWLLLALALSGCASSSVPYRTPDHWSKDGYEWPPGSGNDESAQKSAPEYRAGDSQAKELEHVHPQQEPRQPDAIKPIVGNLARVAPPEPTLAPLHSPEPCLRELKKSGVVFSSLAELKGVENPVEIRGTLGGVTFWANDGRPLELDCRLALALHQLGPTFKKHGVTRARYSGAYSYRRTKTGRLSHHALGLAIDLHDLTFASGEFSVERDFARGVGCSEKIPTLNRLACSMINARLFEEFLTPDYNYDHRDHLHISVPRR